MTTSPLKGKTLVKGKIKGKCHDPDGKKALHPLRRKAFTVAEMERFELSIPLWGIHDFQSCALDQLRDISSSLPDSRQPNYWSGQQHGLLYLLFPSKSIGIFRFFRFAPVFSAGQLHRVRLAELPPVEEEIKARLAARGAKADRRVPGPAVAQQRGDNVLHGVHFGVGQQIAGVGLFNRRSNVTTSPSRRDRYIPGTSLLWSA